MRPIWNRWQCWLRAIPRIIQTGELFEGCNYVETERHDNCRVSVLHCECCGKLSIGWATMDDARLMDVKNPPISHK